MIDRLYLCSYCREQLPQDRFYVNIRRSTGVSSGCIPCSRQYANQWRKNHLDRGRAIANRYRKKKPHVRQEWGKHNRAYLAAYTREWRKTHTVLRRRAGDSRTILQTPDWANMFFLKEAYSLARLRTKILGIQYEVDHIVPLNSKTVCGLHVENNIRVIPRFYNRSKGNRSWPDMP